MPGQADSRYDVFISFAEGDRDWVEGYLLLALGLPKERVIASQQTKHSESFQLGAPVVNEFERAVTSSRYTLLVLSRAYLADQWSTFGEQLASYAAVAEQRNRLIPLLRERDCSLPLHIDFRVRLDFTQQDRWDSEVARLRELLAQPEPKAERIPCPYPGMIPFSEKDARFFYGREDEIRQMLQHFRNQRLLFVIGPSGCGKSSLVFAGVLPQLQTSGLFDEGFWLVRQMRPGPHPLQELCTVLSGDPNHESVAKLLAANPPAQRMLLAVDQFEEFFSQAERSEQSRLSSEQSRFITAVKRLRAVESCALLIAMRADFYPELMNSDLWGEVASHRMEIAPLRGEGLRVAIEKPAGDVGVYLERGLADRLVIDAAEEPGALPLLQETMRLLWAEMTRRFLPLRAYEQLGKQSRTGLVVAIAKKADATLNELTSEQQVIARRIFLRLVQFGEGRPDTRRQQLLSTLRAEGDDPQEFERTLRHLEDNRLVTVTGEEGGREKKVDLAHEALITGWPRLQEWLKERRAAEQTRRRLESKAEEWMRLARKGGLLDEVEIKEAEQWSQGPDAADLGGRSAAFKDLLRASTEAIEEQKRQEDAARQKELQQAQALAEERGKSATRLRWFSSALSVLLLLAISAGCYAFWQRMKQERELADSYFREGVIRLEDNRPAEALAYAARAITLNPAHSAARILTLELLLWRPWPRLSIQTDQYPAVSLSANGKFLLVSSKNGAYLYDSASGAILGNPLNMGAEITAVAISGDGSTAVTGDADGEIAVWSIKSNNARLRPWHIRGRIQSIEFASSGRRFAAISTDVAQVWDASTGTSVGLPLQVTNGASISFGHGDSQIVTVQGTSQTVVTIWDYERGTQVGKPIQAENDFTCAALDDSGRLLMVASYGAASSARVWDVLTGNAISDPLDLRDLAVLASFLSDGNHLLIISRDGASRVWNFRDKTDTAPAEFVEEGTVSSAAISPDRQWVATATVDGAVHIWDRRAGKRVPLSLTPIAGLSAGAISLNGKFVAALSNSQVLLMDRASGKVERFSLESNGTRVAVRNDGKEIALTSRSESTVFWQVGEHRVVQGESPSPSFEDRDENSMPTLGLTYDPLGSRLAEIHGRSVSVMNAQTGQVVGKPLLHVDIVRAAAFNSNGARLVTSSRDGNARLWDADAGYLIAMFHHDEAVVAASWTDGEDRVNSITRNGVLSSWDVATRQRRFSIPLRNSGLIAEASISRNGSIAATTGYKTAVTLWDPVSGLALGSPLLLPDTVVHVPISDDGTWLLTVGNTVRLWDIPAVEEKDASLLARWAEVAAGQRVIDSVGLRRVENVQNSLASLRKESETYAADSFVWSMMRWWFSDPWSRTISPRSALLVDNYIGQLIREGSPESLKEACWAFPEHPRACRR
jgi:WD40 repeat protein